MQVLKSIFDYCFPRRRAEDIEVSRHCVPLDGVRGLAILLVLCYDCLKLPNTNPIFTVIRKVTASGWMGVDLFFVLSGFLITGILLDTAGQRGYWKSFILRRSVRIFPLYYATLLVVFVLIPLSSVGLIPRELIHDQAWYWLYGQNWLFTLRGDWPEARILNHFWSLAVEEQFYIVWPLVVAALSRSNLKRLCVLLCVTALGLRFWLLTHGTSGVCTYVMTTTRMDSLCAGALVALAVRNPDWINRWSRWMLPAFMATSILLVGTDVVWPVLESQSFAAYSLGHSLIALCFASLVATMFLLPAQHPLSRLFSLKPLLVLGKYSYAIYVFHRFVHAAVLKVNWSFAPESLQGIAIFMATLLGSLAVAQVSWVLLEKPFLQLKKYFPRPDEIDEKTETVRVGHDSNQPVTVTKPTLVSS